MTARIDTAARPAWRRPQPSQVGMVVFLASDVMLFAAFFAAYFLLRTENQPWPPADVELAVGRAAAATCVLVASSFTMIAADRSFEAGRRVQARRWLVTTVVLGAAFLANQFAEYATLDFTASSHPYGSVYWLLTGVHAAHVTVGIATLGLLAVRVSRARRLHDVDTWVRAVSLFWHLVDVVWIAVFGTIWLIR